ncbi:MAG: peptidyl-prolyl cis-trans isomerase [Pseudobdellovibrionaceae bacterium]
MINTSSSLKSPAKTGLFIFTVFLIFSQFLGGCTSPSTEVGNQTIAQVNEKKLTAAEFSNRLGKKLRVFDALAAKDPNTVSRAKEEVIKDFILRALAMEWAEKNDLVVSDALLEQEINRVRAFYPDDNAFRNLLAQEGLALNDWKEDLRGSLLEKIVMKKISEKIPNPSEDEIQKDYNENKEKFRQKEKIFLRQIVTDTDTNAQNLKAELKGKKFEDIAKKFSVAPEGKDGGLVGWIERGSVDIFDKAFDLPINQPSQVYESPYGFHIFKVEKKSPAGFLSLSDVREQVSRSLKAQREQAEFASWLDKQIRANKILRNNDLIHAISVQTRSK